MVHTNLALVLPYIRKWSFFDFVIVLSHGMHGYMPRAFRSSRSSNKLKNIHVNSWRYIKTVTNKMQADMCVSRGSNSGPTKHRNM